MQHISQRLPDVSIPPPAGLRPVPTRPGTPPGGDPRPALPPGLAQVGDTLIFQDDRERLRARISPGCRLVCRMPEFSPNPWECQNCGGLQVLYFGAVVSGPHSNPRRTTGLHHRVWSGPDGWYVVEEMILPCPLCVSDRSTRIAAARAQSGITEDQFRYSIDLYRNAAGREALLRTVAGLMNGLPAAAGFYTLYGPPGTGKTGGLCLVLSACLSAGLTGLLITASDLLAEIRTTFGPRSQATEAEVLQHYVSLRVLCLDEIDLVPRSEDPTAWSYMTLLGILSKRYEERSRLLTMLATNRSPADLPDHWQRLVDRMAGGTLVPVSGPSFRRQA